MERWKGMLKIKLRTKIEIIISLLIILTLLVVSVASVTRIISDSSDQIFTFIRNSDGKYWSASEENIQIAIDDLINGGTVWLPATEFTPSSTIYLKNNITLIGSGIGATIIKPSSTYGSVIIRANNKNNVSISSMTIDANNAMGNGIFFDGVSDFLIENIFIKDSTSNGIGCFNGCSRGIVTNIKVKGISGSYEGLAINDAINCIFSNIIVWDKTGEAQAIDFHDIHRCTVSDIIIYDSTHGMKVFGEDGTQSTDNVFTNLNFYNIGNGGGLWIKSSKNNSFSNVHIQDSKDGIVLDGAESINLENIFIHNFDNIGLYIKNDISSCSDININNCIIKGTSRGVRGLSIDYASNVHISNLQLYNSPSYNKIDSCTNLKISDSSFIDGSGMGLSIDSSQYFTITSCLFRGNTGDAIDTTIAACEFYSIQNCIFEGNANAIDTTSSDDNYIISNNICNGNSIDADHDGSTKIVSNNIGTII